jgi:hypothetical protein
VIAVFASGPGLLRTAALFGALIVAMTDVAVKTGAMQPQEAGPLVVAGVLSVVLFPILASAVLGPAGSGRASARQDHESL